MYEHEVKIGRSTPNSSRSTAGSALTPGSAIGAAAFFAFCFYLIYKIIDLIIRPILVFLYRILSTGVRHLYRNRRPIAQAVSRTVVTAYNYCRRSISTWRKLPTASHRQLRTDAALEAHGSSTIKNADRIA